MRSHPDPGRDPGNHVPRFLAPHLLSPTYQNRLRTVGRELDLWNCRSVFVLEVDGGFIVRAVRRSEQHLELMQFADETFPERMIQATEARGEGERSEITSPLAPTGYEDLMRALGRWFDEQRLRHITIAETTVRFVLTGHRRSGEASGPPLEVDLDEGAITHLLNESFRLRAGERDSEDGDA